MESALLLAVFNLPAEQVVQISSDRLQRWLLTQPIIEPASPVTQFLSPRPPVVEDNKRETLLRGRTGRAKAEKTVRISVSLLETLDRLTAELVFTHHQLLSLVPATDRWEALPACAQSIGALTSNLQRTLLEARLQSVETLFTKFTRVVRDLGQKLGKDVHLETEGAEIALDRVLIEGLSDPLAHLIRNALDHGIEAVAERRGTGKEATGQVKISVSIFSKYVQIEVRDDGRGLDPNRLKAKAIEQILLTAEQAERLTEFEAWQLIFAPGFSTALAVTDVSGRGVGMDVVKTNIEQLGGQVDIKSVLGEGTSVLIRLPLTLAMIPALIVNSGSVHFAVQQPSVEAIIELVKEAPLETLGSGQFFHFREEKVPVFTLSTLLDLPASIAAENSGHLLLLKSDGCRFGLLVETKGVAQRILLKPLDESQQKLAFYLGSTVSETGETLFVLDLAALITSRLAVKDEA
jgi:two-component system chemotaxis sensor kinase CheA